MLEKLADWLTGQWASIDTIAQTISGFSTLVIAIITVFLWRENRALRKAGSEPRIVAYFEPHPDGTGGLNIAIANTGTGPARDVTFLFEGDPDEFKRYDLLVNCSTERPPISVIPQGEKISFLFAVGHRLFTPKDIKEGSKEGAIAPFNIRVQWCSLDRKSTFYDNFLLDVRPFADLPGFLSKPYLLKISESINEVGKQIGAIKPLIGNLSNLIEANTIRDAMSKRVKGNSKVS